MNMKQSIRTIMVFGLFALGIGHAMHAQASVVIAGTRVIYSAEDAEVTVKLSNTGKIPVLAQSWLDRGDPGAAPSAIDVPFTLTPPIARIDAGKGQALRILYTGEPLPQDKESVFWLNVLEVPPKPTGEAASANSLQLAFRTRIKFFYRPASLKGGDAAKAPAQVTWRLVQDGSRRALQAHNPTAFHVSFSSIEVSGGGETAQFTAGGMVGPGATVVFPLEGNLPSGVDARVSYLAINDYGGAISGETVLNRDGAAPK